MDPSSLPSTDTGAQEFLANLTVGEVALIALVLTLIRLFLLYANKSARSKSSLRRETPPWARSIAEVIESFIIAGVLVFLIIRPFFVQAFFIPSESMENTLMGHDEGHGKHEDTIHDHIFVNKLIFRYSEPKHGDIIVFKAPKDADTQNHQENVLIKRLIGLPGDTIEVKDGAVYRNGKRLDEPASTDPAHPIVGSLGYAIKEPMDNPQPIQAHYAVGQPLHLGPDELFVMGDNRNDSNDSRYWGPLKRSRVMGKAVVVFWPLQRLRILH